ncbi:hypothetical protein [Cellulomonas fengjieae]|uniref:Big-1 domain-containing protein n=1 Tax=Cellulomonas fengjieae TaxID=2819978 RepID=A0ABS3SGW4_9CELL|nr:hypothetical protein [Cellulomonas fengjieae]MBO3084991.1 hypothetical protein [Cellulomonas fengjieae]MBO3100738.1 hypothetical protein [Cellulomonas fengjieae]QVI66411.1 hypothetical protein KG102_02040 [Cellulomonas fengjieae]
MASIKSKKSRKGLAVALAVLGVAGLSLASASQLSLSGTPQLQAGVNNVAGCQTTPIAVAFTTPTIAGGEYKSTSITLSSFDAACTTAGAKFKVALLDTNGAVVQETAAANVATGVATIALTTATPNTIGKVAVTIFS